MTCGRVDHQTVRAIAKRRAWRSISERGAQNIQYVYRLRVSYHIFDDIATPTYDGFPSTYGSKMATPRSWPEGDPDAGLMD